MTNESIGAERPYAFRDYLSTMVLGVTLALSLAGNVFLAWRVQAVSIELKWASARLPKAGPKVGATLPAVPVKTVTAASQEIRFNEGTTVLYVVSQTCSWCQANEANIRAVASAANLRKFHFKAVVLEPENLSVYATRARLPFDVVSLFADAEFRDRVGFSGTPLTVVVASGGVVEKVWMGAWNGARGKEIGSFFQTELPGLETTVSEGEVDR